MSGAERAQNRVEQSGAWSGRGRKRWSGAAWSGRSRSGNGAESAGYRNRLERGAAFSPPLTRRSHALIASMSPWMFCTMRNDC